jgi:hypothetical protein
LNPKLIIESQQVTYHTVYGRQAYLNECGIKLYLGCVLYTFEHRPSKAWTISLETCPKNAAEIAA